MIYEMRTYDLKPRSLAEVEKRFGEAYEKRKKYSELAAFWHTEIGPLNQIIHVWGYKDLEERGRIREVAVKEGAGDRNVAGRREGGEGRRPRLQPRHAGKQDRRAVGVLAAAVTSSEGAHCWK